SDASAASFARRTAPAFAPGRAFACTPRALPRPQGARAAGSGRLCLAAAHKGTERRGGEWLLRRPGGLALEAGAKHWSAGLEFLLQEDAGAAKLPPPLEPAGVAVAIVDARKGLGDRLPEKPGRFVVVRLGSALGLRDDPVDHTQLEAVARVGLERGRPLL